MDGWMQEMEVQGGRKRRSVRDLYVLCKKYTTLSVQNQVMQNHFSSASHSLGSICAHSLGFFWSIQSLPPSPPAHLGHTDLAKGLRRGEIENKREGGKQTEGQLKEPGLNRRAKRGYVNTGCVVNSTSFLSSIQFQIPVLFIEANVCVFFIHPWIAGEEMQNF